MLGPCSVPRSHFQSTDSRCVVPFRIEQTPVAETRQQGWQTGVPWASRDAWGVLEKIHGTSYHIVVLEKIHGTYMNNLDSDRM